MKVTIKVNENQDLDFDVYTHKMSEIKINDFWGWLNRIISVSESRKLLEIVDCDYKRQMIIKYSKK